MKMKANRIKRADFKKNGKMERISPKESPPPLFQYKYALSLSLLPAAEKHRKGEEQEAASSAHQGGGSRQKEHQILRLARAKIWSGRARQCLRACWRLWRCLCPSMESYALWAEPLKFDQRLNLLFTYPKLLCDELSSAWCLHITKFLVPV